MKYLMTLIVEEGGMEDISPEEMKEGLARWHAFDEAAIAGGVMIAGEALQDSSTATTIKVGDGAPVTIDGPFAEAKEQLGGFYLLDCENLDEALEWAAKIPLQTGSIEVRPARDFSGSGYETPTPSPVNAAA